MGIPTIVAPRAKRCLLPSIPVLAFLLLAGCSTVTVETRGYPGAPTYAPVPHKAVVILRDPPDQKYQRLGEIQVKPQPNSSAKEIFKSFQKAAAKIGADAVVLVADPAKKTGGAVAGPGFWKRDPASDLGDAIVGVAIWFPRPIW